MIKADFCVCIRRFCVFKAAKLLPSFVFNSHSRRAVVDSFVHDMPKEKRNKLLFAMPKRKVAHEWLEYYFGGIVLSE